MADKTLLLVDDEENILRALTRLLRRDGYDVVTACSGEAGLTVLAEHPVCVILSDQRMPGMSGIEFLERAQALRPDTIRVMLSGYTDFQSVTDAINRGAIWKFLTKPWEDDLLRENVRRAFAQYGLRAERDRLDKELATANEKLSRWNESLERRVEEQTRALTLQLAVLEIYRKIFEILPVGVVGVDGDMLITVANAKAHELLGLPQRSMLSRQVDEIMPPVLVEACRRCLQASSEMVGAVMIESTALVANYARLWHSSGGSGGVLVLLPVGAAA